MSLTYYGPFDLITFSVDENNVVTLGGYVVFDSSLTLRALKNDTLCRFTKDSAGSDPREGEM